ncbi:MAG: hypothetical protein ACOYEV_13300 [Candidatus Nanopelagicales bacterium]
MPPTWLNRLWANVATWRARYLLVLNLTLAIAVGYLLEKRLLRQPWGVGERWLAALGLLAGLLGALVWSSARVRAASHGALLNMCVGPGFYRDRQAAEHATLTAWAANHYPTSLVLSPLFHSLPAPDPERSADKAEKHDEQVAEFAKLAADKLFSVPALAPGAGQCAVLPMGQLHAVVQAGGQLAPLLGAGAQIVSDVTDGSVREPYFSFCVPPYSAGPERVPLEPQLLLAIMPSAKEVGLRAEGAFASQVLPRLVWGSSASLPENRGAYEQVLAKFGLELPEQRDQGHPLSVVAAGPAALAFAAGLQAGRAGWRVRSAPFVSRPGDPTRYGAWSAAPSMPCLPALGAVLTEGAAQQRARLNWRLRLGAAALFVSLGLPTATGAFALLLEWFVARSTPAPGSAWLGLFAIGLAGACLTWLGWSWESKHITKPAFTVESSRVFAPDELFDASTRQRTVRLWRSLDPPAGPAPQADGVASAARPYSDWIKARLVDIIAAYPNCDDLSVRIPPEGFGPWPESRLALTQAVVAELNTGFRGNRPVTLICAEQTMELIPQHKTANEPVTVWEAVCKGLERR